MSHTDKTRPVWVQVRDPENRWAMQEDHDHRQGVCDYDEWFEAGVDPWDWRHHRRWSCHLDYSYYGYNKIKFWSKPPKSTWDRHNPYGKVRAQWLRDRARLLKAVDPEEVDYVTPRQREILGYIGW